MSIRVAFFVGNGQRATWLDRVISAFGTYSHCALVIGDRVQLFSEIIEAHPSAPDGVRIRYAALSPGAWHVFEVDGDGNAAAKKALAQVGRKYGYLEVLSTILPIRVTNGGVTCSMLIAELLNFDKPWSYKPDDVLRSMRRLPGFRAIRMS